MGHYDMAIFPDSLPERQIKSRAFWSQSGMLVLQAMISPDIPLCQPQETNLTGTLIFNSSLQGCEEIMLPKTLKVFCHASLRKSSNLNFGRISSVTKNLQHTIAYFLHIYQIYHLSNILILNILVHINYFTGLLKYGV